VEVLTMYDDRLDSARIALKIGLGGAAFLAGADKFFGFLTDWPRYLSPLAAAILPLTPRTFMHVAGVIEMVVGLAILGRWTRLGSFVAAAWLVAIAVNLVFAGFFDVAVRDVEMAIAAYALARLTEVHDAHRVAAATPRTATRVGAAA
jgi:hypothetical protein